MTQSIDQNVVDLVARLITEDTNTFNEALVPEGLFGFGKKKQAQQVQQATPDAEPQAKVFQFDLQARQSARAFVEQVLSQLSKVLGHEYVGALKRKRGGLPAFAKALERFFGQVHNSRGSLFGDVSGKGATAVTKHIANIADDILNQA